jgi:hypothetical protein
MNRSTVGVHAGVAKISQAMSIMRASLLGLGVGAASWGVVSLMSDRFEPFDSTAGFIVGQALLSVAAALVGWTRTFWHLVVYLVAAYVGMNGYAYAFGGDDQRARLRLALVTTLSLVVVPLLAGVVAYYTAWGVRRFRKTRN